MAFFIFASENEGGQGLLACGAVTLVDADKNVGLSDETAAFPDRFIKKEALMPDKSAASKRAPAKSKPDVAESAAKKAAKEAPARPRARADKQDGESAVLAKIAEMEEPSRALGGRLHAIIKASAPVLAPKLWYGMPAYAKDGKVVCFFRGAQLFKERYMTLGFTDAARLDEGALWPVAYALKELTAAEAEKIGKLVKKAVR